MRARSVGRGLLLLCGLIASVGAWASENEGGQPPSNWPQWRGPLANGISPDGNPPVRWSEDENIRFKVAIPGRGLASPVVWNDRIFILTAVPADDAAYAASRQAAAEKAERREFPPNVSPVKHRFVVMALSRKDGSVLWERTAVERSPHEGHYVDASWASASPVTDGKRLIAHFGSNGTFAYDLEGNLLWKVDLGEMRTRRGFGEGSSPALHGDTVVINQDHEGDSFIVALDAKTGKQRWKVDRPDEVTSWATPLIVAHGDAYQVVVPATGKSRAYDLKNGRELWRVGGMTVNTIPSPVHRDGVVYLMSGFRGNALQAIALDRATGELEGSEALVWTYDRDTPYVPSPLLYDGKLCFLKHLKSILSCLDADSGKVLLAEQRLPTLHGVWSSPVGAAGRIYVFDRDGHAVVLQMGAELKVLGENTLDEGVDATPAIVEDALYVRGLKHLYCIAASSDSRAR